MYLRLLSFQDYDDYMKLINEFRESKLTKDEFNAIIHMIMGNSEVWIAIDNVSKKIIGTGTIIYEYKFIHNGSKVAHIEDVIIGKDYKGKGYGKQLIKELTQRAFDKKCYKIILNCSEEVRSFYEKCGYTHKNIEMEYRFK